MDVTTELEMKNKENKAPGVKSNPLTPEKSTVDEGEGAVYQDYADLETGSEFGELLPEDGRDSTDRGPGKPSRDQGVRNRGI